MSSYPAEIVSNTKKNQAVLDQTSIFIRGVESIAEDDFEYGELLKSFLEKLIEPYPKEVKRLSVSLLGDFKPSYIGFYGKPDEYWNKISDIDPHTLTLVPNGRVPVFLSYDILTNTEPVSIYLDHLKKECKFKIELVWAPMNSNFYHYEFRIINLEDDTVVNINSKSSYLDEVTRKIASDIIYLSIQQDMLSIS